MAIASAAGKFAAWVRLGGIDDNTPSITKAGGPVRPWTAIVQSGIQTEFSQV